WNQTANYALCDTMYFGEWTEEGLFTLTCEAPKPVETKYYAKNNWNGAAADDWSWLEMSATNQENVYMLDSVVFGGTGVNINTKTEDTDALWFAADAITVLDGLDGLPGPIPPDPRKRDTIIYAPARTNAPLEAPQLQAGDTIKLFFNAADSTLSAAIVGRPAPAARKEFVFVAGEAAEANPALFAITWGKDGSNETVKLANKADDIYTAEILETVDSVVLVRCASDATEIIWDGEGKNVWNQTANYELCDTMYFESWVEETNLFTITCDTPKPVGEKYYITGNAALVGEEKAWSAQAIEMTDGAYTFTALPAGEYEMKITNGAWEPEGQSWGSAALSEECSAGVGDKEGNIHFIVETPNDVNVAIAEGKVTVIGTFKEEPVGTGITVNVTVPVGTPACYFYGEMSGNLFAEMTKLDDTHYTITFPHATSIGWGYLFVWENGNWNTKNADPEGDITVEPVEGVIDIEIKAWVTNPGTEYKYTTYTEWQVKFGPAWEWVDMTKQEEGVFAVNAVWGTTTGMNIASGENPIKQDWYPLGDAALTVEEDVAEGDNVVITLTVVDDETVALNVAKGEGPTPAEEGFGIIVNGTEKIKGQKNEAQVEFLEYLIEANLTAGATFQLYDFANDAPWTEANIDEASTKNVTINANNLYEVAADGKYTIYLKMFGLGNNQVYIAFTSDPTGLIEIMRNTKDGKFIINGKMIIRRNGALYTIQGARL
ncbi:MAG: hypothetical protein KBS70_06665, partial [Bacteroidales bacterium]|nr:hypothetical protein [Candidatus Colicola equi]